MTGNGHNGSQCLIACTGALHLGGGIAGVNRLMLRALADAGCHITVFALQESNAIIDTRYVPLDQITYHACHGRKARFVIDVWRTLATCRYDYVFVDHVNIASMLFPLRRLAHLKYYVWLCGVEVFPPRPDREGRLGLTHATNCLAISEFTRASVAARFPATPIAVCDLALDPVRHDVGTDWDKTMRSPMRLAAVTGLEADLGTRVVLHVGRMASSEKYKGQDVLLQCFPELRDQFPDAQLVLVGEGDDYPRLLETARSLPEDAQSGIFMPGYITDAALDELYRTCFAFAMPSIGEGFGLVFLEAMGRGKPCIGGKVDATPFVVRNNITGLLVDDPRSTPEVTSALVSLFRQPEQAADMGRAGYDLVQSYYLYEHFRDRFWKALGISKHDSAHDHRTDEASSSPHTG